MDESSPRTLDRYVRAAREKAGRTGRPAPSREQIAFALSLAYGRRVPDSQRINTLTALRHGVSRPHCGLLIQRLKPLRQPAAPAPKIVVSDRSRSDVAAADEDFPPPELPSPADEELVSAFGSWEDNDHHHPFI